MADVLSNALNIIYVARKSGKRICVIKPVSKLILQVLDIISKYNYISKYEIINDARGGFIRIEINDMLNNCKSIRPRIPIKGGDIPKYEKRFLPALGFGIVILSTNKGLMTHEEAKKLNVGGSLIAYVY